MAVPPGPPQGPPPEAMPQGPPAGEPEIPPGAPAPEPKKPPKLIPPAYKEKIGRHYLDVARRQLAPEVAAQFGPEDTLAGADPMTLLRIWRYTNPLVDAEVTRRELRDEGKTEELIEDELVDRMHPLRRILVNHRRPEPTQRVEFSEYMNQLDRQTPELPQSGPLFDVQGRPVQPETIARMDDADLSDLLERNSPGYEDDEDDEDDDPVERVYGDRRRTRGGS